MFSWLRRKPASNAAGIPSGAGNPGIGVKAEVGFARGGESWTEEVDVVRSAARALDHCGHEVISHETWLELPAADLSRSTGKTKKRASWPCGRT